MSDRIYAEIGEERSRQDIQWGGPEHDDEHGPDEWCEYIGLQLYRAEKAANWEGTMREYRERLIKIAALSVAALES
tara:strand:- start:250 stop:477 length:228 start_codon:yes stop_codon:yes gene_type:complete